MKWKPVGVLGCIGITLLVGCSGGGSNNSEALAPTVVVVSPDAGNEDTTAASADSGSNTDSDLNSNDTTASGDTGVSTDGSDTGTGNTSEGGDTQGIPANDAGNTDAGSDDANNANNGSTTSDPASTDGLGTADTTAGTSDGEAATTDGTDMPTDSGTSTTGSVDTGGTTSGTTDSSGTADSGGTSSGATSSGATDTSGADSSGGGDTGGQLPNGGNIYPAGSLAAVLSERPELELAMAVLTENGIGFALNDPANTWTLFLPTNDAIEAAPSFDFLRHIHVSGALSLAELNGFEGSLITMNTGDTFVVAGGGETPLIVGNGSVLAADITGNSGSTIVHVIDSVLSDEAAAIYPTGSLAAVLQSDTRLSLALTAFRAEGLDLSLNNPINEWTVFMPTNDAIEAATDFTPRSHIYIDAALSSEDLVGLSGTTLNLVGGFAATLQGGGTEPLLIGGAPIIEVDIMGNSGTATVHIIDAVLD